MKKFKSDFTINDIGKFQFYSGIAVGIGFCFIFNTLFRQTLRLCNIGVYINELSWSNIIFYKFSTYYLTLIAFTSVALSFCFTTYLWMSKPTASIRRKTLKLRFAQTNSMWIFSGTLLFLTRLFWFLAGVDLTIEKDFPYLGFMVPIYIYLYCWNLISDVYKSKKAFLIASLLFIVIGIYIE